MPPRAATSPAPVRKSPRKSLSKPPSRLGIDDDWGAGAAGAYKSEASSYAAKSNAEEVEKRIAQEDSETSGAPIVGAADVLTLALGFGLFGYGLQSKNLLSSASLMPSPTMPAATIAGLVGTAIMVAGSHILYALIWYNPKKFKVLAKKVPFKFLGKHAVAVFGKLVLGWKISQQLALCAFVSKLSMDTFKAFFLALTPELWALAATLFALGQVLNGAIYYAIGEDGVYYGFKLGRPVPWATGFPFNAGYRHPQYVGAMLSQLGVLLVFVNATTLDDGLGLLLVYWTALYVVTSYIEATGDNDK